MEQGLFELRFIGEDVARRITYVVDTERRVVTLTTFHKRRDNERAEVLRARRAASTTEHRAATHLRAVDDENGSQR